MKYLKEFAKKKTFDIKYASSIVGSNEYASLVVNRYLNSGFIRRIKKNLYSVINIEYDDIIASKYDIASSITANSFVSLHSALEFYGYCNQVYSMVTVSSINKFNEFEYDGYIYNYIHTDSLTQVINIKGVNVSTLERTIVDCICMCGKYYELEELINDISIIEFINEGLIMEYLIHKNSKMLFKKVGFILELFKDNLHISNSFFNACHEISDDVIGYFNNMNKIDQVFDSKWKLYIDSSIKKYTDGNDDYV